MKFLFIAYFAILGVMALVALHHSGFIPILIVFVVVLIAIGGGMAKQRRLAAMSPEERAKYEHDRQIAAANRQIAYTRHQLELTFGRLNSPMICPHCQYRNCVRTMPIKKKAGVSGGKLTAAVLTGGVSLLATGLSRKEQLTQAHCDNCNSTWSF